MTVSILYPFLLFWKGGIETPTLIILVDLVYAYMQSQGKDFYKQKSLINSVSYLLNKEKGAKKKALISMQALIMVGITVTGIIPVGLFGLFIWSIPVGVHLMNVEVFSTGLNTFVPASHSSQGTIMEIRNRVAGREFSAAGELKCSPAGSVTTSLFP